MADKLVWFVEDNSRTLMLILITRYLFIVIIILHVVLPTKVTFSLINMKDYVFI